MTKQDGTQSTAALVDNGFWAPPDFPYLEIRTTRNSRRPYATHFHHAFSIGLILEGETVFTCAGHEYRVARGDIVFIEPEMAHSCNPVEGQPRGYHMLFLDSVWCAGVLGDNDDRQAVWRVENRVLRQPDLFDSLVMAVDSIRHDHGDQKVALFNDLIRRLLVMNCRRETSAAPESGDFAASRRPDDRFPAERPSPRRETLIRIFRRKKGLTPGAYRQCQRLLEASRSLRRGAAIVEAALAAGFADQSHFHRMFVKYFSATPRQYRLNRSLSFKK